MDMDNIRSRRTGKIRQRIPSLAVVLVVSLGLLTACGAWTRPDDNQIRAAIQEYHEAAAVALELDYATMKVPQRSAGSAAAVIWTPDHGIQRNYRVEWDGQSQKYSVISYLTLERGEDGVYRQIEEIIVP